MTLGLLLREHRTALDADLRRFYQFDLPDLFDGDVSPDRVAGWVESLPPECAVKRSQGIGWQQETQTVLAHAVAALWGANWQRGGGKGDRPGGYPMPWDEAERAHVPTSNLMEMQERRERELAEMTTESG